MNEKEQPSYYAVIPATVRYDSRLKPNEKLLYGEITSLSNKTGLCFASNRYFAELYEVEIETISRWIKHLKELGYIDTDILYFENSNQIDKRVIKIDGIPIVKKINTYCLNNQKGIDKKVKDNNTSINIKEINNNKLLFTKKKFKKPTLEEVTEYCRERKNNIDPQSFIDSNEAKGWVVGKNQTPMKDWKAAIRTWENNENQKEKTRFTSFNDV